MHKHKYTCVYICTYIYTCLCVYQHSYRDHKGRRKADACSWAKPFPNAESGRTELQSGLVQESSLHGTFSRFHCPRQALEAITACGVCMIMCIAQSRHKPKSQHSQPQAPARSNP